MMINAVPISISIMPIEKLVLFSDLVQVFLGLGFSRLPEIPRFRICNDTRMCLKESAVPVI